MRNILQNGPQLPEEIKVDDVTADLKDGVLKVTLQKKAPK